jgi:hypothetical protein
MRVEITLCVWKSNFTYINHTRAYWNHTSPSEITLVCVFITVCVWKLHTRVSLWHVWVWFIYVKFEFHTHSVISTRISFPHTTVISFNIFLFYIFETHFKFLNFTLKKVYEPTVLDKVLQHAIDVVDKLNKFIFRRQGSHLSVYGTDSPYIGRFVRVRSLRSLTQLNVRIFLKKAVVCTNCPYFSSQKP